VPFPSSVSDARISRAVAFEHDGLSQFMPARLSDVDIMSTIWISVRPLWDVMIERQLQIRTG